MTPTQQPVDWLTIDEAAKVCRRRPQTILNLVSKHQLPRRLLWKVHLRMRRRVMFLAPETVAYLQRITLYGENVDRVPKPRR